MHLVWFKRDLRVDDHCLLADVGRACRAGEQMLGVYVYEPIVYQADDFDVCHLYFINESLVELRASLRKIGGELLILHGEILRVFEQVRRHFGVSKLWSHEENGNSITFDRDLRVAQWVKKNGIQWVEKPQNGVIRRLKNRDGWATLWTKRMLLEVFDPPDLLVSPASRFCGEVLAAAELELNDRPMVDRQRGGSERAWQCFESFIGGRGESYRSAMSSPVTAYEACSRLSPYLAFGNISVKQVFQRVCVMQLAIKNSEAPRGTFTQWRASLKSFQSRLRWHCHFIQKMEDQPDIDTVNIARSYDGIRGEDAAKLEAWRDGQTGYSMIDACMRALRATGWLNFRMRAMVMSFASYHLWIDWRASGLVLARYFVDYEPGIHWSQVQMQSGTTGINSVRVYSPIKQVTDQDPDGTFIRKWVPELANVPNAYLAEPHTMPVMEQTFAGCRIGDDYPEPIVNHTEAYRLARDKIHSIRKSNGARIEATAVYRKHGSRRKKG